MSVKVSKVKNIEPPPISRLSFDWTCTNCGTTVESDVVEGTLLQYKTKNLGPMKVARVCPNCETKHSMELSL